MPDGTRPQRIALDVETVSLKDRTPIGLSVATSDREALYFPLWNEDNQDVPWDLIRNDEVTKVYHNAPFDLHVLKPYKPSVTNIVDTLTMAHLLNMDGELSNLVWWVDPYNAKPCRSMKAMLEEMKATTTLDLSPDDVAVKCCQDTIATMWVFEKLKGRVDWEYFSTEMQLMPILYRMSLRGIAIDQEERQALEEELTDEMLYYRNLAEAEGFNPGSPKQVGYILAKRGTFLPFSQGHRQLRTDVKVLEKVQDPLAAMVLQYRHYQKALGTYVIPARGAARMYTRFHLDAATGRISSTERNLQNIPPQIRSMFLPDNGVFTDADFSQIELRILAYMSGDREMKYIFESGGSIHQATAEFMNIPYKRAKNVGFGMIYGATVETVMETAKTSDKRLAQRFIDGWSRKYKEAWDWIQYQQEQGLLNGKVRTLMGREFVLVQEEGEGAVRRKAVNYPIQGSAAEIFKRALIMCQHLDLANQLHDQVLIDGNVELPAGLDHIVPDLPTPISIKRTARWT
jgi:DNA polymerase-1